VLTSLAMTFYSPEQYVYVCLERKSAPSLAQGEILLGMPLGFAYMVTEERWTQSDHQSDYRICKGQDTFLQHGTLNTG
jgi:hypothetical protein